MRASVEIRIELLRRGLTVAGLATKLKKNPTYMSLVLSARVRASDELYAQIAKLIGKSTVEKLVQEVTLALKASGGQLRRLAPRSAR